MEKLDKYEELVRNSNLVATAERFVPKSPENLRVMVGNDEEKNDRFLGGSSHTAAQQLASISAAGHSAENGIISDGGLHQPIPQPSTSRSRRTYGRNYEGWSESGRSFAPERNKRPELCVRTAFRHPRFIPNITSNKWKEGDNYYCSQSGNHKLREHSVQEYTQCDRGSFDSTQSVESSHSNDWAEGRPYKSINLEGTSNGPNELRKKFNYQQTYSKFRQKHAINKFKQELGKCDGQEEPRFKKMGQIRNRQNQKVNGDANCRTQTNQRDQLIDMLMHGKLECLVCCELITQNNSIWNCSNCYHILHLKCVIKWAKSSRSNFGWRCPACQNTTDKIPVAYFCFCGKIKNPEWNHQDCPHSCGEVCGKSYRKGCPHKCTLLCHPGPCPQCTATISKTCGCQKTVMTVQCFSSQEVVCDEICGRELTCLSHTCTKKCHPGECEECQQFVGQDCYCKKVHREVKCSIDVLTSMNFSCGTPCGKKLNCGIHNCRAICHEGDCPGCELVPDAVKFCACGQTEITALNAETRTSCADPMPKCHLTCGKILACGPSGKRHTCQSKCHEGDCPECSLETAVKCRCGHKSKVMPCRELSTHVGGILCDKRCTKKRTCGKHKCNQVCCTGVDHDCLLPCNRFLQCGLHRCEDTCHRGHCKPCLQASFEELTCECGAEVIFPPVPCGTRRPPCERPCTRTHDCDHPPVHSCHSGHQCPPCTVLTKKYCHGRHELRKAVPCYLDSFSCGLPCGKELECGRHKCMLPCHPGPCLQGDRTCSQPCTVLRASCGHICGLPCHEGPCSFDFPCKEMVRVTCECGRRYTTQSCHENTREFQVIATSRLATKMADLQAGQRIDLNDVAGTSRKISFKTLECDEECKLVERNRRLALALQIKNPDLSAKLTPRYSEYLKNWAKRDPRFCQMVHDKLTDLVQLAKQSKQKSRSYSFDPMNREKRHFVHEYCDHFGCESVAYDQEPKRNVVATALKDKSWLPSISIIEFIHKENSPRKIPVPVIYKSAAGNPQRTMEVLPRKSAGASQQSSSGDGVQLVAGGDSPIDYFDWRPQNE